MMIQAGDLAVELDTGNNQPGAVLQRHENGRQRDYLLDGQLVRWEVELLALEPGRYRVAER